MTSDPSGSSWKVSGNRIAIAGIGPIPGSTPISVPRRQPSSASPIFLNVAAAVNPVARLLRKSNSISAAPPRRKRLAERIDENDDGEDRQARAEYEHLSQIHVAVRIASDQRQSNRCDREPDAVDQDAEDKDRCDDENKRTELQFPDWRPFDRNRA